MPWASFSMLDGPGGTGCDVSTRFLQSEVKIIHIIVQNNTYADHYSGIGLLLYQALTAFSEGG